MKHCLVAVALLVLAGCAKQASTESKPESKAESKPNESPRTAGVVIDGVGQQKAGIFTAAVQEVSEPEYLTAPGQIVYNDERTVHIGSMTEGRVTEVHANIGDFVNRGAVLARMHSHDVHETRAAYDTALQDVERRQNTVAYQERMRDRMIRLFDLKSASRQEVEKAEADLRSARTDLNNAQIAVTREVAHLTDILHLPDSALKNINEETEQVPVIASMTGTVIDRKITNGAVVEPGEETFAVSDLTSVWMLASVSEADIGKVRVGDRAQILSPGFPEESFGGRVTRLGSELDPKTRTLQVRILVPNPQLKLRAAMYVNAQIQQGHSRKAVYLPEEAIQDINGDSVVFVRDQNNRFEARPVQIRQRRNGQAEFSAGLRAGEIVVVKGSFIVKSEMLKSQIGE